MRHVRRFPAAAVLVALAALVPVGASVAAQEPRTGAERAGFERFTAHDELIAFLYDVQSRSDRMLVEVLATTDEGRAMPIVYLGAPPPATAGSAWFSGRPTVFFTGNVHGGERAGREGSLQLIRELAAGELRPLLERINVLIVPTLNPDGAERRARTNSLGYDMNRDFIVAETPEISAILEKVLLQWWPDVYVDVHNGGAYPYNVTYQATLHPAADRALVDYARGPMFQGVQRHLAAQDMKAYWYSGPRRLENGDWVWATTEPWARKQHSYGGLHNMFTLLFEIPGRWTLREQADNAREAMEGLLRFVADNADAVRATAMEARRRTVGAPPAEIPIQITASDYPEPERFFVMQQGQAEPQLVTGRNRTLYVPTSTRPWPWAYAFDARLNEVASFLRRHAIQVERLVEPVTTEVESYRLRSLAWGTAPYQNHLMARAEVELARRSLTLPAGTYLVRMSQNAARLIAQLFEPDTEDSLLAWNFLDHSLPSPRALQQAGGGGQGRLLPLYRIPTQTGVRATLVR